jgi:hypothetical protein
VLGGIGLILVGMIFGDIFAVFVLHQNAARVGAGLSAAAHAALAGDPVEVGAHFADVGSFLENRGTKVDVHVHMIDFGYLALLLALVQPWVAYRERMKRHLARLFLIGSVVLPVGVFLIHYIGLVHSPLQAIGWASIFADLGGVCVLLATAGFLVGVDTWQRGDHLRPRTTCWPPQARPGGDCWLVESFWFCWDLHTAPTMPLPTCIATRIWTIPFF